MGDALKSLGIQRPDAGFGSRRRADARTICIRFYRVFARLAAPRRAPTERFFAANVARRFIPSCCACFPKTRRRRLLYLQKEETRLGRTDPDTGVFPDVDLCRFDPGRFVSRHHASIKRNGTQFFITAQKTLNPTRVDGFLVAPGATVPLNDSARVEFADLVCNFLIRPVTG